MPPVLDLIMGLLEHEPRFDDASPQASTDEK
jgi:hypothetical protein